MFDGYLKMAVRIATIAIVAGAIILVFSWITIPAISTNDFVTAIGFGKAVFSYYLTSYQGWLGVGFALLAAKFVLLPVLKLALIGPGVSFKINEG